MDGRELLNVRLRAIKSALAKKPYPQVSIQVAKNLHDMLEEAKAQGHLKRDIANQCWPSKPNNPEYAAKQLSRITLAQSSPGGSEARLDKKPTHYVAVAKAWAKAMGQSEDAALLRLFVDSNYGSTDISSQDGNFDAWDLLAHGLKQCALHVIRLNDLAGYYRKVQSTSGRYDARWGFIHSTNGVWNSGGGLALTGSCSDEVEPVPSIRLARRLRCSPIPGSIWIDRSEYVSRSSAPQPYVSHIGYPEIFSDDDAIGTGTDRIEGCFPDTVEYGKQAGMEKRECVYRLWLDIRLAAAPAFSLDDISPLIEVRSNLDVTVDGDVLTLDNPFTDGKDIVRTAIFRGKVYKVALETLYKFPEPFQSPSFDQPTHTWFAWAPIGGAQLQEVLGDSSPFLAGSRSFEVEYSPDLAASLFPQPAIRELEWRLRSGALDRELNEEATRLLLLLEQHRGSLQASFDEDMDRLNEERTHRESAAKLDKKGGQDNEY